MNIVKEVFEDACTTAGIHFEFGSPKEIQENMSKLGLINKTKLPALLLFNNWEEDIDKTKMSVSDLSITIAASGKLSESSEQSEARFDNLLDILDDILKVLAADNRIYGTSFKRFPHSQIRRYYSNMGGSPAVAWLVKFTENNNFNNICKNERF